MHKTVGQTMGEAAFDAFIELDDVIKLLAQYGFIVTVAETSGLCEMNGEAISDEEVIDVAKRLDLSIRNKSPESSVPASVKH